MPTPEIKVATSARSVPSRAPIEGPSAWIGADMRGREAQWTYRLSPPEIAEIEAAVKEVQARGLDIADIRRADFPLPTLASVLDRLRAEVLDGRGFVLLRGVPVEDRPVAESATAYWGIGTYFGSARSQNAQGHLLGHVYDLSRGLSATNPNLRSYATAERQNFHIDRCDVVALLCLRRAKSGGLSSIVSSMTVHNVIAERRPDLLDRLYQPFPVDRRGEVPQGKAPFYDAPVFNEHADHVSVLYSRLHIGSAQRFPEARRLTVEDIEALDMLAELAGDPELRLDMNFMPGDIQFLHNHTILHARSAYEDWPEAERKRHFAAPLALPAGSPTATPSVCGMLRRSHDRRSRRHHLQENAAARTAYAWLSNVVRTSSAPLDFVRHPVKLDVPHRDRSRCIIVGIHEAAEATDARESAPTAWTRTSIPGPQLSLALFSDGRTTPGSPWRRLAWGVGTEPDPDRADDAIGSAAHEGSAGLR